MARGRAKGGRAHGSAIVSVAGASAGAGDLPRFVALVMLCALSVVWIGLSMTTFFVGPAEWDDNVYCDVAAVPRPAQTISSRFVHIWTLRIFNLLMDSRRTAAALYSALTVIGLMWIAFFIGQQLSGAGCGLLAAALMPLYPSLLKYMTVPYSDEPMAMWSGAGLLCALLASGTTKSRTRSIAVVACGLCCFLSVNCKKTGLTVLPAVVFVLWACDGKLKVAVQWAAGVLLGWLSLTLLDLVFLGHARFNWQWPVRFAGETPRPSGALCLAGTVRMSSEFVDMLLSRPFLAFSLLGVGGMLISIRENRIVRGVALWAFWLIAFQSLVSCRYKGIHALDRYCVSIGVPLIILGAHWVVSVWRRKGGEDGSRPIGLIALLLGLVGLAGYGLVVEVTEGVNPSKTEGRISYFLLPLTVMVVFAVPWLTTRRWLIRASLIVLLVMSTTLGVHTGLRYVERARAKMKPWAELARALDETGVNLAIWKLPKKPYARYRVERRARTQSTKPAKDIRVRKVDSLDDIKGNEWLFTDLKWWRSDTKERKEMLSKGWRPFVSGAEFGGGFVVCRRE